MKYSIRFIMDDKIATVALFIIVMTVCLGLFAPWMSPHDPLKINMDLKYATPSMQYWLGNDQLGRCVLSRLIHGIRPSILAVIVALFVTVAIGSTVGFVAGYFGGKIDASLMRVCDVILSFPGYVMPIAFVGVFGAGLVNILLSFVLFRWAWFARAIRTSVLQYTNMEYVQFSRSIGIRNREIIKSHIFPVTLTDILILSSSSVCSMILQVSAFSFLGLGVQAPSPEWGMMLNESRKVMFTRPELLIPPTVALVLLTTSFNYLSDSLQRTVNPSLQPLKKVKINQEETEESSVVALKN